MAYRRTNWQNEETPLNADNMNNLEDGVGASQIDEDVLALFTADGWVQEED